MDAKKNDLFQSALGRISFTSDCWSDPNLASFLAITAHFIARKNGSLVLCNKLLAFRIIEGAHDGENLARIIFAILKEAHLLGKVCFAYYTILRMHLTWTHVIARRIYT
jgi:hypothetical protein